MAFRISRHQITHTTTRVIPIEKKSRLSKASAWLNSTPIPCIGTRISEEREPLPDRLSMARGSDCRRDYCKVNSIPKVSAYKRMKKETNQQIICPLLLLIINLKLSRKRHDIRHHSNPTIPILPSPYNPSPLTSMRFPIPTLNCPILALIFVCP